MQVDDTCRAFCSSSTKRVLTGILLSALWDKMFFFSIALSITSNPPGSIAEKAHERNQGEVNGDDVTRTLTRLGLDNRSPSLLPKKVNTTAWTETQRETKSNHHHRSYSRREEQPDIKGEVQTATNLSVQNITHN